LEDIILQYTYPRLDAEVSKHRNHLLKAPFCIHPKTSRVCVPVDPAKVDDFDPEKVPTVGQLLRELDAAAAQRREENGNTMEVDGETKDKEMRSGMTVSFFTISSKCVDCLRQTGRRRVSNLMLPCWISTM
jgi:DNA primase catalytic subunit